MLNDLSIQALKDLGERIRALRIERGETQVRFAARVGVSVQTYQKLEAGLPTVQIGIWVKAIEIFGKTEDLDRVLEQKRSLFELYEAEQHGQKRRRRVSRRSS